MYIRISLYIYLFYYEFERILNLYHVMFDFTCIMVLSFFYQIVKSHTIQPLDFEMILNKTDLS